MGIGAATLILLVGGIVGEAKRLTQELEDTRITKRGCATG
jgi:hypothetical protein